MTSRDIQLEQIYKASAAKSPRKNEETITRFDRRIFLYNIDEVNRQLVKTTSKRITYEDHRRVVETATAMLGNTTQHEVSMSILTHRYFADYRANAFEGLGGFNSDYAFVLRKVGNIFDAKTSQVNTSTVNTQLKSFKTPTLVQVNHLSGTVKAVTLPTSKLTLREWVFRFNLNAPETTTYQIAGLSI